MQHGTKATSFPRNPSQQQEPDNQHERRANPLQKLDSLDALPNHKHIDRPEKEKTNPMRTRKITSSRPNDSQHRIDGLSPDPRLNAEPPARHKSAQHRRNIGPA